VEERLDFRFRGQRGGREVVVVFEVQALGGVGCVGERGRVPGVVGVGGVEFCGGRVSEVS
jgi:hypothetical protein